MKWALVAILLSWASIGWAEYRGPYISSRAAASDDSGGVTQPYPNESNSTPLYGGFDLGVEGRTDGMAGNFAGMETVFGGRAFLLFPLNSRWSLEPSLGYFRGGQSLAGVSVLQQIIEPGVTAEYTMARSHRFQWWVGGVDRVEVLFSTINVLGSSGTGPPGVRDRLGPATGIAFRVVKDIDFKIDTEIAASVTLPVRFYPAATAGFILRLK